MQDIGRAADGGADWAGVAAAGGSISPLGPDSTWGDTELQAGAGPRLEARLAALETRLLKDQEEKFTRLMEVVQVSRTAQLEEEQVVTLMERVLPRLELSQKTDGLAKALDETKTKIELLLGGEQEANKLIDSIAPGVEKTRSDLHRLERDLFTRLDKVYEESKKLRDDQKRQDGMITDTLHHVKKMRDEQSEKHRRLDAKVDELKKAGGRRSRSDSSEAGRRRHASTASRASRSRSRTRRERRTSRETSTPKKMELELEKSLAQIQTKLDAVTEKVVKIPVAEVVTTQHQECLQNQRKILQLVEAGGSGLGVPLPPAHPKSWEDDDRSPSPPKRKSRSPGRSDNLMSSFGMFSSPSKESKTKRKRKESSSSSSSEERSPSKEKTCSKKDFSKIISVLAEIDKEVKKLNNNGKKGQNKVEETCKQVLDRVGEMTLGVQVIAENLDSVNDVSRKMEVLDKLEQNTDFKKLSELVAVNEKLAERLQAGKKNPGGWEETRAKDTVGGVSGEELRDIVNQLDIDKKFCEFGGLMEELTGKVDKKLDRVFGEEEMPDLMKRLRRLESLVVDQLVESVKRVELRCSNDILPAVSELLRGGGTTRPGPGMLSPGSGLGTTHLSDYRASQLEKRMSEILPKLDDVYIKVLPVLDEIKQRQRKEAERENVTIKEVKDCQEKVEKIMDMVEDLLEGRETEGGSDLSRRINSAMELEPVMAKLAGLEALVSRQPVGECLNALVEMRTFTAKQGSLDRIERLVGAGGVTREEVGAGETTGHAGEAIASPGKLERKINTVLEFLKKEEKTLDMFMKNSMSDAKALSQCNTAIQVKSCTPKLYIFLKFYELQGMKAAVSANGKEVLGAVQGVAEQAAELRTELGGIGGSVDELCGQVRSLDREAAVCGGAAAVAKLQTVVEKMVRAGRGKEGKDEASRQDDTANQTEVKSQLDALHDLLVQQEEALAAVKTEVTGVKSDVNKHDKNIGLALNNLAKLLKVSVDRFGALSGDLTNTEKKEDTLSPSFDMNLNPNNNGQTDPNNLSKMILENEKLMSENNVILKKVSDMQIEIENLEKEREELKIEIAATRSVIARRSNPDLMIEQVLSKLGSIENNQTLLVNGNSEVKKRVLQLRGEVTEVKVGVLAVTTDFNKTRRELIQYVADNEEDCPCKKRKIDEV